MDSESTRPSVVVMVSVIAAGRVRIVLQRTVQIGLHCCVRVTCAAAEMTDSRTCQCILCTAADAAA